MCSSRHLAGRSSIEEFERWRLRTDSGGRQCRRNATKHWKIFKCAATTALCSGTPCPVRLGFVGRRRQNSKAIYSRKYFSDFRENLSYIHRWPRWASIFSCREFLSLITLLDTAVIGSAPSPGNKIRPSCFQIQFLVRTDTSRNLFSRMSTATIVGTGKSDSFVGQMVLLSGKEVFEKRQLSFYGRSMTMFIFYSFCSIVFPLGMVVFMMLSCNSQWIDITWNRSFFIEVTDGRIQHTDRLKGLTKADRYRTRIMLGFDLRTGEFIYISFNENAKLVDARL